MHTDSWPSELRKVYRHLRRRVENDLPHPMATDLMNEAQQYLNELSSAAAVDFSIRGLRELSPTLGKIAAYRSRVAALQIKSDDKVARARSLKERAEHVLSTVRAVLADSDSVAEVGRADLRREKIFALSVPASQQCSRVRSRLILLEAQASALHLTLTELDALQKNLSRQMTAIQLDLAQR